MKTEITTQQLFDVILTHIRIQRGHGCCVGYDTSSVDGCKCIKGIWISQETKEKVALGQLDWRDGLKQIEFTINRKLTDNERLMFNVLEAVYENSAYLFLHGLYHVGIPIDIERYKPDLHDYFKDIRSAERRGDTSFRTMSPLFEPVAKELAKQLGLKYTEPTAFPWEAGFELKEINEIAYRESVKAKEQKNYE